ncbi:MAG TPA: hypothetical protein VNK52_12170 [Hyphomicrobiaceae bacterium]|nr:hypothetical protein [Hyphomicrobiaceae bacterium]
MVAAPMKTASQSVYASLQNAFGSRHIYHTHWLGAEIAAGENLTHRNYLKQVRALRALADRSAPQFIVTIIRDPAARLYSNIFHHEAALIAKAAATDDLASISDALWARVHAILDRNKDYYLRQFLPLGLNILAPNTEFGRTFLVFRMEDLTTTFPATLKRATGREVSLIHKNDAGRYGPIAAYEWLKRRLVLPSTLIDELYEDKVVRHFYTDGEICAFKQRLRSDAHEAPSQPVTVSQLA